MGSRSGAGSAAPGAILISIHDFVARSPDELSLAKGDRIELLERDDDFGDGWFLGKHMTNGHSGLFPEVYTTPAPKGTLSGPGGTSSKLRNTATSHDAAPVKAAQAATANLVTSPVSTTHSPTIQRNASATAHQSLPAAAIGAQAPVAPTVVRSSAPINSPAAPRSFTVTSDSPVMSETLSVIDEHITDMHSPRASYANGNKRDTLSSVYSSTQPQIRRSYIAGHETDEEEHQLHTEEEVMAWGPARVAEYLDDHGVEKAHCEVFKEQEISGEVLLAMDQNSLFIKEFELGAIGRRLKTWHKIKTLQDEVKRANPELDRSVSAYSLDQEPEETPIVDTSRNRSSTIGAPSLPRALTTKRQSGDALPTRSSILQDNSIQGAYPVSAGASKRGSTGVSPLQAMTSTRAENTHRPSAQGIRNLNHSKRHSSIDSTSTDGANRVNHRKKASIDQRWEPGQHTNGGGHVYTASTESSHPQRKSGVVTGASPDDIDRGYFSSNEADSRIRKSVLTKRNSTAVSPMQSRANSFLNNTTERYATTERHLDPVSPIILSSHQSNATAAVTSKFGGYRSATTPAATSKPRSNPHSPMTPVVTKLDPGSNFSLNAVAASPTNVHDNASDASSDKAAPSPSRLNLGMFSHAKAKVTGLRSISDAVTKNEKIIQPVQMDQPAKSPTRTGSSTPSTGEKSLDLSKSDMASRASTGSGGLMPPPPAKRPRAKTKTKKMTSAYTRGLEKKPPHEAMANCDYSGWMKKKSGSLMTTWKTRLFILRGRRLSYYYADDDTEEKGLIDISYHRVLPAHNETLTGLHATVTGAASPASPTPSATPTMAEKDLQNRPPQKGDGDDSLFIFKLVPPKAGLAKGVSFTKPTVHYFAVNSRQEGRLWMAALMKATIDRDDDGVVTTTYNQKTISLAKAQARRERPPALKEEGVDGRVELKNEDNESERGLGIGGISEKESAVAGAENGIDDQIDGSSIAPSSFTNVTETENDLTEKEREAVALNAPS